MAFLSSVNGGGGGTAKSSGFLGGVRQLDERERKYQVLKQEADKAEEERRKTQSNSNLAVETVKGIPNVLRDVGKMLVDDPMKTLATPVIRAEQAAVAGIGRATGSQKLEDAANRPLDFPSILGGSGGTIEPQRGWDEGGAAQIGGETAKYGATIYTGGRAAPIVGTVKQGLIRQTAAQGAKEGAIGTGAYMGGDEATRPESTVGSIATETGKGLALGTFLGGILSGGGAALAKPGAVRAAAEAEAIRLRPLPIDNTTPTGAMVPESNIRRFQDLPVEGGGRARQVPINRAPEPYLTPDQMPTIQAGPKAKSFLPEIQIGAPTSRAKGDITYEPIPQVAPEAPAVTSRATRVSPEAPQMSVVRAERAPEAKPLPKPKPAPEARITSTGGRPFAFDHYSTKKGLKELDPNMAGTGTIGTERQAKAQAPDLYEPTSYGYKKGEQPEKLVADNAPYKYEGKATGKFLKVGTMRADEIARKATAFIKANAGKYGESNSDAMNAAFRRFAKEQGYDGIIGADGKAIAMFNPVEVRPSLDKMVANAFSDVKEGGGATVTIYGDRPKEGFVVAVSKASEKKVPEGKFTEKDIYKYADSLYNDLQENDAIGLWKHEGDVYMDVVRVFDDEAAAARHAVTNDQIAYYDLKAGKEVNTGKAQTRLGVQKGTDQGTVPSQTRRASEKSGSAQVKTGRPVTMDIPRKTATVEPNRPKPGQTTTTSKAATDANRKLAEQGYETIPDEELARIGSINKADQIDKVSRLMDDPRVKDMAAGSAPVPDGVAPQVLFNAVKNKAVKEGDSETLRRLARSRIAEERATAAQTLGSAGYNNEPADAVRAMNELSDARVKTAERRRQPSDVKKEAKTGAATIKKARAKETWDSVVDALTC